MSKEILWLDNDAAYLEPYVDALTDEGYKVTVATTVGEASFLLNKRKYDLLILDVMIPTKSIEEEAEYRPEETEYGHKTGLVFYRRIRERLNDIGTKVLIMTVRLDADILNEFVHSGLMREQFATKFALRDVSVFIEKVRTIISDMRVQGSSI